MKYVALLRGINVGGNMMIKMVELKKAFEFCGFTNVITYINSGNVIFGSEKSGKIIRTILEAELSKTFHSNLRLVIRSEKELKRVLEDIPSEWKDNDLRKYVAFIREPVTPKDVRKEVETNEGIDFVKEGKQVLYMSTKLSGITKSKFTKLAGKKVYQDITIRNYNTVQKIMGMMD